MSSLTFPKPGETRLIGRAREVERLREVVEDVRGGARRAVLLVGEAGIGKSTLLRRTQEEAEARGFLSAFARVPASAGLPPRFPVGEILVGLAASCDRAGLEPPDALPRMIATLTGSKDPDAYPVDVPQVSVLLEGLAEHAPIIVMIDDIQWAGTEGLGILVPALRIVDSPVLLVATARAATPESLPSVLEPGGDLRIDAIDVRALGAAEAAALAEEVLQGPILPSLAESIARQTLGNPLFIVEMLRDLHESEHLVRVGGYWSLRSEAAGTDADSLRATVGFRLGRLPERELAVAQALALLGRPASFTDVCIISALEPDAALEALDLLERRGLCATDDGTIVRYRLAHPLYASCIRSAMTGARRAAVHAQIFAALLTKSDGAVPASELAHHAVAAHQPPANIRELLEAAAAEAEAAGSFREAATWYAHLSEIVRDDTSALQQIKFRQARASVHFSPDEAVDLYSEALELAVTDEARAEVLAGRAYAYRVNGEFARAMTDLERALPWANAITSQHVLHSIGVLHGIQLRLDQAESALQSLRDTALDGEILSKAHGHLSLVAMARGDLEAAERCCRQALASDPSPAYANFIHSNLLWILTMAGKWDEAHDLADRVIRNTSDAGDLWNLSTSLSNAARLIAWRGDIPRALDCAVRALRLSTHTQNQLCSLDAHAAIAVTLFEGGSPVAALESVDEALTALEQVREPVEQAAYFANAAEIYLHQGHNDEARALIDQGLDAVAQSPQWLPYLERLSAAWAHLSGDTAHARERILEAIEAPCPMPFERANQLRLAAAILHSSGEREQAFHAAEQAADIFHHLQAMPRERAVRTWIADHQPRKRGRPSNRRDGLTEREWEVLAFIAQGLSNPEIAQRLHLSVATVRTHVERLRRATDSTSRTELALYGVRRGLSHSPNASD